MADEAEVEYDLGHERPRVKRHNRPRKTESFVDMFADDNSNAQTKDKCDVNKDIDDSVDGNQQAKSQVNEISSSQSKDTVLSISLDSQNRSCGSRSNKGASSSKAANDLHDQTSMNVSGKGNELEKIRLLDGLYSDADDNSEQSEQDVKLTAKCTVDMDTDKKDSHKDTSSLGKTVSSKLCGNLQSVVQSKVFAMRTICDYGDSNDNGDDDDNDEDEKRNGCNANTDADSKGDLRSTCIEGTSELNADKKHSKDKKKHHKKHSKDKKKKKNKKEKRERKEQERQKQDESNDEDSKSRDNTSVEDANLHDERHSQADRKSKSGSSLPKQQTSSNSTTDKRTDTSTKQLPVSTEKRTEHKISTSSHDDSASSKSEKSYSRQHSESKQTEGGHGRTVDKSPKRHSLSYDRQNRSRRSRSRSYERRSFSRNNGEEVPARRSSKSTEVRGRHQRSRSKTPTREQSRRKSHDQSQRLSHSSNLRSKRRRESDSESPPRKSEHSQRRQSTLSNYREKGRRHSRSKSPRRDRYQRRRSSSAEHRHQKGKQSRDRSPSRERSSNRRRSGLGRHHISSSSSRSRSRDRSPRKRLQTKSPWSSVEMPITTSRERSPRKSQKDIASGETPKREPSSNSLHKSNSPTNVFRESSIIIDKVSKEPSPDDFMEMSPGRSSPDTNPRRWSWEWEKKDDEDNKEAEDDSQELQTESKAMDSDVFADEEQPPLLAASESTKLSHSKPLLIRRECHQPAESSEKCTDYPATVKSSTDVFEDTRTPTNKVITGETKKDIESSKPVETETTEADVANEVKTQDKEEEFSVLDKQSVQDPSTTVSSEKPTIEKDSKHEHLDSCILSSQTAEEPKKIVDVPEKIVEVPEKAAEVAEKAAEVAEKAAEVPEKAAEVPEKAAEVPEKAAEVPEKAAEVPEKAAEVPEKAAEVPEKAAEVPEKAAEVPEKAAEVPEKAAPDKVSSTKHSNDHVDNSEGQTPLADSSHLQIPEQDHHNQVHPPPNSFSDLTPQLSPARVLPRYINRQASQTPTVFVPNPSDIPPPPPPPPIANINMIQQHPGMNQFFHGPGPFPGVNFGLPNPVPGPLGMPGNVQCLVPPGLVPSQQPVRLHLPGWRPPGVMQGDHCFQAQMHFLSDGMQLPPNLNAGPPTQMRPLGSSVSAGPSGTAMGRLGPGGPTGAKEMHPMRTGHQTSLLALQTSNNVIPFLDDGPKDSADHTKVKRNKEKPENKSLLKTDNQNRPNSASSPVDMEMSSPEVDIIEKMNEEFWEKQEKQEDQNSEPYVPEEEEFDPDTDPVIQAMLAGDDDYDPVDAEETLRQKEKERNKLAKAEPEKTNVQTLIDKLHRQARVEDEVKHVLKVYFKHKEITKEEYKSILRKAVPQVANSNHSIDPERIRSLVKKYVAKIKGQRFLNEGPY